VWEGIGEGSISMGGDVYATSRRWFASLQASVRPLLVAHPLRLIV